MSDPMVGATTAVMGVHLSVAVPETVAVQWETVNGTAIAGVDYEAANGTVTFAAGETEKQIEVVVYGADVGANSPKNFYVKLHPPTNAILFTAFADCMISVVDEGGVAVTKLIVAQGKRGLKGDPGLSAYEQAVLMGYEGTVEDWMNEIANASQAAARAEAAATTAVEQGDRSTTEANRAKGEADRAEAAADAAEHAEILDSRVKTWSGRTQDIKNRERVSILDYGADYSADCTAAMQAALNDLNSKGGGTLHLPYMTGLLRIDGAVTLYPNIKIVADEKLVIDLTRLTSGYSFTLIGTIGAEIPLANAVTSGGKTIDTTTAHGLSAGDMFLLKSQRPCTSVDAGTWRLGETTDGAAAPYFAEVHSVFEVPSTTSIGLNNIILFPDYKPNKVGETDPSARDSSTVQKLNLLSNFEWVGGTFLKEQGNIFRFDYTSHCYVKADFRRGYGSGVEIYNLHGYCNRFDTYTSRPMNWSLNGADHSGFNSVKDVSSWYSEFNHKELYGSQGLDQTYTDVCVLFPTYNVNHTGSHEDGMTTHGCSYGATINVIANNCAICALRNRTPHAKITVNAVNCANGIIASAWGTVGVSIDINAIGTRLFGVEMRTDGVTSSAPPYRGSRISGHITGFGLLNSTAIRIDGYAASNGANSGIIINNLVVQNMYRAINAGLGVNGITINNVTISEVPLTTPVAAPIYLRGSAGHFISNIFCDMTGTDGTTALLFGLGLSGSSNIAQYGTTVSTILYDTIRVVNGLITSNSAAAAYYTVNLTGTSGTNALHTLQPINMYAKHWVNILANTVAGNCRLVLNDNMRIGQEFKIFLAVPADVTLVNGNIGVYIVGVTNSNLRVMGAKTKLVGANFVNMATGDLVELRFGRLSATDFFVEIP